MGTTAHGIYWPEDYETQADLPIIMGDNAQSIEAALVATDNAMAAVSASVVPIGSILAFGGSTAPANWHLCDGTAHGSAALQAVTGSANAPDLRNRFVVGAGGTYAVGAVGGLDAVVLTGAQSGVAAHTHPGSSGPPSADHTHAVPARAVSSDYADANHSHAVNPPSTGTSSNTHSHTLSIREGTGEGDGYYLDTNPTDSGVSKTLTGSKTSDYAHTHTVDIPGFSTSPTSINHRHGVTVPAVQTDGASASHTHTVTVAAAVEAPAAAGHENRPPYFALVYIIRKA